MYQTDDIIAKLAIQDWPQDKKDEAVERATFRIGQVMTEGLNEQQFNEYEAIVNDDQVIIDAWLDQNEPEYKSSPIYQSFEEGYDEDPESNSPTKLFATVAWIQKNVPDIESLIERALNDYKQELST
jgi:hypothetical protein